MHRSPRPPFRRRELAESIGPDAVARQSTAIAVFGITAAAILLLIGLQRFDGIILGSDLALVAGAAVFAVILGLALHRRWPAIASALVLLTTFPLICLTFILLSYAAARYRAPLRDALFSRADHLLAPGFDWPSVVLSLARHPLLARCGDFIYGTPYWQSTLLIVLLCVTGRSFVAWRFVLAWALGLVVTMAVFALMPAAGAYAYYGIPHRMVSDIVSDIGWRQPAMLSLLRRGIPMSVNTGSLIGIVEFPSFHAVAAVLLTRGFWALRIARWPVAALNAAMLAASAPMGGHYLVDIVAGTLLGSLCALLIPVDGAWSAATRSL